MFYLLRLFVVVVLGCYSCSADEWIALLLLLFSLKLTIKFSPYYRMHESWRVCGGDTTGFFTCSKVRERGEGEQE